MKSLLFFLFILFISCENLSPEDSCDDLTYRFNATKNVFVEGLDGSDYLANQMTDSIYFYYQDDIIFKLKILDFHLVSYGYFFQNNNEYLICWLQEDYGYRMPRSFYIFKNGKQRFQPDYLNDMRFSKDTRLVEDYIVLRLFYGHPRGEVSNHIYYFNESDDGICDYYF